MLGLFSDGRDRLVFSSGRGLVNGRTYEKPVSQRCVPDGDLETKPDKGLLWHTDRGSQYALEKPPTITKAT